VNEVKMSENPTAIGSQGYSLRPYQTQLLDKTRAKFSAGTRSIIVVSPTGSRKTILFCSVVDGAMRSGKRCLVFTHRREIAEQTSGALAGFAVMHGIVMAGTKPAPGLPVRVASISTLMHQLDEYSNVDLLVIDEAHHSTARTWRRVIDAMPRARILGTIATKQVRKIREMEYLTAIRWAGTPPDRLRQVAMARGYRPAWVQHQLNGEL
jgi:superfamily II DNA or RNA helicase